MKPEITADAVVALITEQQVIEIPERITVDTDLFASGLDSMALMQLLLHLEDQFGVTVQPSEITKLNFGTAGALAKFLQEKSLAAA